MSGNENILSTVECIFPATVYISNLNRQLNEDELSFLDIQKQNLRLNQYNYSTVNNFILHEKELSLLKKDLELHIDNFFYEKLKYNKKTQPYITQSWLNVTKKNESHHQHEHPNSFLSGVYYVKTNTDVDKIRFSNTSYQAISPNIDDFNVYNSKTWWFHTEMGGVFIFPSSLTHSVLTKNDDNERISIAFNIFVKGELGNEKDLTHLKLESLHD